jgi:peptide deformylase
VTIRAILQGDIPELRATSAEVTSFDEKLASLLEDLIDTVTEYRGLGLSAPQIGILERVFVVDLGDGVQEFINPQIIDTSGEIDGYESCLSFPEYTLQITRPKSIKLLAQDRTGHSFQIEASDLLARVICHELDHLNGVLFMDHLSEEELFAQLFGNAFAFDEQDDQHEEEPLSESERLARQQELQLAIDMLSELSWKLTLSLEILKDYNDVFDETIDWNRLEEMIDVLDNTILIVEGYTESLDE